MSLDIAREVMAALSEAESVKPTGWKWRQGVVLFPETRCPYCRDVVRSKAVWLVRGNSLIGQAVPRAGRSLVLDEPEHPHATPSDICMGNAVDPLQALFTALNPESVYVNMIEWLQGKYWEHSCDAMESSGEDDGEDDGEDVSDEFCCEGCEEFYDLNERNTFLGSHYCSECYSERCFSCEGCDRTFSRDDCYVSPDGSYNYCEGCYAYNYFKCERCEGDLSTEDRYDTEKSVCCDCIIWCDLCDANNDFEDRLRHCNMCAQDLCESCAESHEHLTSLATLSELESLGQETLPL